VTSLTIFIAPEQEANKAMSQLQASASRKGLHLEEILIETPYLTRGGIRSQYLVRFVSLPAVTLLMPTTSSKSWMESSKGL